MLPGHPILSLGTFIRPLGCHGRSYKVRAPQNNPNIPMCLPATNGTKPGSRSRQGFGRPLGILRTSRSGWFSRSIGHRCLFRATVLYTPEARCAARLRRRNSLPALGRRLSTRLASPLESVLVPCGSKDGLGRSALGRVPTDLVLTGTSNNAFRLADETDADQLSLVGLYVSRAPQLSLVGHISQPTVNLLAALPAVRCGLLS